MRCAPRCSTLSFSVRSGSRRSGGSGGPTFPQAARKTERKREIGTERRRICPFLLKQSGRHFAVDSYAIFHMPYFIRRMKYDYTPEFLLRRSQDVPAEVLVLHDVGQHPAHVIGVYDLAFIFQIGAFERNLVEDFFQDSVQAARAYVFGGLVDLESEVRHFVNRVFGDFECDAFGLHQRLVLFDQGVLWLGQDALEVIYGQRLQFDADREPALQFGDQVRRLRDVESPGRHDKHVAGVHHAVLRAARGAFDDRQDVALHAFARNVGAVARFAPCDLVDLVQEDDARRFDALEGDAGDLIHVYELLLLLLHQVFHRLVDAHPAVFGAPSEQPGHHVLEVDVHLLDALVGVDFE